MKESNLSTPIKPPQPFIFELGLEAEDVITKFKGTIIGRVQYLFGCNQYGLLPKVDKDQKTSITEYFDEGRIRVIGKGIRPESVKVKINGANINRDCPKK